MLELAKIDRFKRQTDQRDVNRMQWGLVTFLILIPIFLLIGALFAVFRFGLLAVLVCSLGGALYCGLVAESLRGMGSPTGYVRDFSVAEFVAVSLQALVPIALSLLAYYYLLQIFKNGFPLWPLLIAVTVVAGYFIVKEYDISKIARSVVKKYSDRRIVRSEQNSVAAREELVDKIQSEYQKALQDPDRIHGYLYDTRQQLELLTDASDYAYEIANFTTKLLLNRLHAKDYSLAEDVFNHYVDHFLPRVGLHAKTSDVASLGLSLSILAQKENVAKKVFDKIFGPDFDIAAMENNVLLFNLAAYYALHQDKPNLLLATKQSLVKGHGPEPFLSDPDFKGFINDPDFLAIVKAGE